MCPKYGGPETSNMSTVPSTAKRQVSFLPFLFSLQETLKDLGAHVCCNIANMSCALMIFNGNLFFLRFHKYVMLIRVYI
jgi:hypothetical protein